MQCPSPLKNGVTITMSWDRCAYCNERVDEDDDYCPRCGAPVPHYIEYLNPAPPKDAEEGKLEIRIER